MSHFSVLVIRRPDQVLEDLLAPFHEFECTGLEDQYIQDIDITEEARADYAKQVTKVMRDPEGNLHDPYEDRFYRDLTPEEHQVAGRSPGTGFAKGLSFHSKDWGDGQGYRAKTPFVPEGWEKIELPASEVKSFAAWAKDWYGYPVVTEGTKLGEKHKYGFIEVHGHDAVLRIVKRTNPDAKWDWWVLGGRFSGMFAPTNPYKDPRNMETCFLCGGTGMRNDDLGRATRLRNPEYTCNGCDGTGQQLKSASEFVDEGNEVRAGLLDLKAMKAKAVRQRREWLDEIKKKTGLTEDELQPALEVDRALDEAWRLLEEPRPLGDEFRAWAKCFLNEEQGVLFEKFLRVWSKPRLAPGQSLQEWLNAAPAMITFAVLKDGQWYENGKMGWWGAVRDEKDEDEWARQFEELLKGLDPDLILSVVDCHI